MISANIRPAEASGTFSIGGDLVVNRLGFGAMQLPGLGVWGEPIDHDGAVAVLRRTAELGITLIDTADAYGPFVADRLIREALYPYADGLVIASKVGFSRQGANKWAPLGRPEYLRQQVELNLRHLGLERIDLLQLQRIDPKVALEDQLGELGALQKEGKIRHIGLSQVSLAELETARTIVDVASVQNRYNLADRASQDVLDYATAQKMAFIPWFPLATGKLVRGGGQLSVVAQAHDATPAQIAIAWLLRTSPVMLPIPGTANIEHLDENCSAALIELSDSEFSSL